MLDLAADIAHGLDAAAFAEDRLGFNPDQWQRKLLRSTSRFIAINAARQVGKTTTTAALAVHVALYEPDALILLFSKAQRQSRELFSKCAAFLKSLTPVEELVEDNRLSCRLKNGARIISLPGDGDTVRGYSAPALVVEDEAAYCSDALHAALLPMLAVSQGRLILMSTPNGRRGHFYEIWSGADVDWERYRMPAQDCPRLSPAILDEQKRKLGPLLYSQEFECAFIDAGDSAFNSELIERALGHEVPELFAHAA